MKNNKIFSIENCIMMVALLMIFFSMGKEIVLGAQGNTSYKFYFDYVGDTSATDTKIKWYSNDSAYINCTYAEFDDAYYEAIFCFQNDYDGTQYSNPVYLWEGSERWVSNYGQEDDITWFKGKLMNDGGYEAGCTFDGRWRPDASSY